MKVLRNREKGTLTLRPSSEAETAVLREIQTSVPLGEMLNYEGRGGADPNDPVSERMRISFALNGGKFDLLATTDEDEDPVRWTRDAIFFGGGGLILLGHQEVDGLPVLDFTVAHCKLCNKPMISMGECEWRTCDACKDACAHEYERGMVHGGSAGIMAVNEFCTKCGRGKPEPEGAREKSQIENELAVQRELGVHVLYANLPFGTGPTDVIQAKRFARRLERARKRNQSAGGGERASA